MQETPSRCLQQLGWNCRVLSLDDFYAACEHAGVLVFSLPMRWRGVFFYRRGLPVIVLNDRLRGHDLSFTAWHEYAHFLYHTPGWRGIHGKTEMQADVIAAVALIPVFLLHLPDGELQEFFGYSTELLAERVRIFRAFNV